MLTVSFYFQAIFMHIYFVKLNIKYNKCYAPRNVFFVFSLSRYRSLERCVYFRNHDNTRAVYAESQEVNLLCDSGY